MISNSTLFYTKFIPKCNGDCIDVNNCILKHSVVEYNYDIPSNGFTLYDSNAVNTTVASTYSIWQTSNVFLTIKKSIINDFKFVSLSYMGRILSSQSNITFEDSSISNLSTGVNLYSYSLFTYARLQFNFAIRRCKFTLGNLVFNNDYASNEISIIDSVLTKVSLGEPETSYIPYEHPILYMRNVSFLDGNLTFYTRKVDIAYSNITVTTPFGVGRDSNIYCSSIGRSGLVVQASSVGLIASSLTITNSTIKNFGTGIQAVAQGLNKIMITKNNFYGNSLYNVENKGAYDINAISNYWGTNNVGVILNKIYDYWDDINYGDVLYKKYSTKALPAEAGCPRYIKA